MDARELEKGPATAAWKTALAPAVLVLCLLLSVVLAVARPLPHAHKYDLAVGLTLRLLMIWLLYRVVPSWVFRKGFLLIVLLYGLVMGTVQLATVDPQSELVPHYASVFSAMKEGRNPYACGTIYHEGEFKKPVYGDFNYPPMEIYPYWAASVIAGRWTIGVLTATMLLLQALACLVFVLTCVKVRLKCLLPFMPIFLFEEVHTNPAMTLLAVALILWAVTKSRERPGRGYRYVTAALFGVGLMTKFLVIPLAAAYYANRLGGRGAGGEGRRWLDIALEAGTTLGTALLLMAPFGVVPVLKNTVVFNLVLKDRAALTTFFPNVLSGLMSWLRLDTFYPFLAVALLAAAIWAASKLELFSGLLAAAFTFLLVAPTPRSQFIPSVLYIAVVGIIMARGERGAIRPAALSSSGASARVVPADRRARA